MFRSLLYGHPQGSPFVLSAFTTFRLLASSFAFSVCGLMPPMCMCVQCTCLWVVWSWGGSNVNLFAFHKYSVGYSPVDMDIVNIHTRVIQKVKAKYI
jgi:hypothetical protein